MLIALQHYQSTANRRSKSVTNREVILRDKPLTIFLTTHAYYILILRSIFDM